MNDDSNTHDLLGELAEEFVSRWQAGELPTITEFCQRHPQLEDEIRDLFPALIMLEDVKPQFDNRATNSAVPIKLGPYQIIREIGFGGMSVVYEAEHEALGRRVALKALACRLARDGRARARFEREARAVAKMHHTNIVPLFDVGEDDGQFFLAMQLIPGKSLDHVIAHLQKATRLGDFAASFLSYIEKLNENPSSVAELIGRMQTGLLQPADTCTLQQRYYRWIGEIGLQAAGALAYAHERGIIHRDIKPSNLILDDRGVVWLTDFGLAKTDDEELTQTKDFLGTLRYMSPERFKGECAAQADIYSLGLTLYELISLQPAYQSVDRLALVDEIVRTPPQRLRRLDRRVPRDLETIIHKAIDKVPAARYTSANELADDLNRFLADQPVRARRQSKAELLARWSRRNRGLAASLAGVALMLLLVFVGSILVSFREASLRQQAVKSQFIAEQAQQTAEERREELRRTLYSAEMNLAGQAADAPAGTNEILMLTDRWRSHPGREDLRGWEWFYLRSLCGTEDMLLNAPDQEDEVISNSWSPDGNLIALAYGPRGVTIWDTRSGHQSRLLSGEFVNSVAWSPHGSIIAMGGNRGTVSLWDADSGKQVASFMSKEGEVRAIAWGPDGDRVAWGANDTLYLAAKSDLDQPTAFKTGIQSINTLQWSADGSRIACGNWWANKYQVWDITRGVVVEERSARFVGWSIGEHEVERWLRTDDAGTISIADSSSGATLQRLTGHRGVVRVLAWSEDQKQLASGSADGTVRIWDVDTGTCIRTFQGHTDEVFDVAWNPDGKRIVSSSIDGTARVWKLDNDVTRTLFGHDERVRGIRWNPARREVASASFDGTVRIWAWPGGQEIQKLVGHAEWVHALCWSPDGNRLASVGPDGVIIWDVATGKKLDHLDKDGPDVLELDWSPCGRYLATIGRSDAVRIWDLENGELIHELDGHFPFGHTVRWSPQGDRLATTGRSQDIKIWDGKTFKLLARLTGHKQDAVGIAWSPDGKHLASGGEDEYTVRIWDVRSQKTTGVLKGHHGPVWGVDWNPDGSRIASASRDGTVRLWDAETGIQTMALSQSAGGVWCVGWSDDGHKLAAGYAGGTVVVWDATRGYEQDVP